MGEIADRRENTVWPISTNKGSKCMFRRALSCVLSTSPETHRNPQFWVPQFVQNPINFQWETENGPGNGQKWSTTLFKAERMANTEMQFWCMSTPLFHEKNLAERGQPQNFYHRTAVAASEFPLTILTIFLMPAINNSTISWSDKYISGLLERLWTKRHKNR